MFRKALSAARLAFLRAWAPGRDRRYEHADVPRPELTDHTRFADRIVEFANKPGMRVLEIGSREVTGVSHLRARLHQAEYVGFDYYPGPNVDVVGDAHRLASYFDAPFDAIYSSAVFEHLAMPWVVAEQIAGLLKIGGLLCVETHFSYASHERPWHFFQFSDMGLRVLFGEALGFECLEASLQNPIVGRFSHYAAHYLRYQPVTGLYCHANYMGRKVKDVGRVDWSEVDIERAVQATRYPAPK